MSDAYLTAVNSGFTKTLAKKLGLPQPAPLRRFKAGRPLIPGPVLVLGPDDVDGSDSDQVAAALLDWDLDVRRNATTSGVKWGAIVVVLSEITSPTQLSASALGLSASLRELARGGRVVTISRQATAADSPTLAAARQGVDGFVRSLAKELRGGATANGIVLTDDVGPASDEVLGPLRFFLSSKSSYVDGQLLGVRRGSGVAAPEGGPDEADAKPLAGRVAVVTGAAQGIGAAIARTLARDGARVIVVDVPAAGEGLAKVANEIHGTALQLDITAEDAGRRILEHATTRHGGLHIVVHNAGITRDKLLANMSPDRWDSVIAVNIAAQLRINEFLLASGQFTDAPRIVSLASTSGIAGNRGQTNYATSKAGVIGMVRATAPLLADIGGTANAVAPGFIETDMTKRMPFATREVARRLNALSQAGQPIDVAEAVAFLASGTAGGVSGQTLRVCGQAMVGA